MIRTYDELISFDSYLDRFKYLKLCGTVGANTFGHNRYLNQQFYSSPEWRSFRNRIIVRDNGCDLGIPDYEIGGPVYIHHMNPVTLDHIINRDPIVFDPNNVICVAFNTHQAIHYGDEKLLTILTTRARNDTCPWRK